jgi:hypothetical protein
MANLQKYLRYVWSQAQRRMKSCWSLFYRCFDWRHKRQVIRWKIYTSKNAGRLPSSKSEGRCNPFPRSLPTSTWCARDIRCGNTTGAVHSIPPLVKMVSGRRGRAAALASGGASRAAAGMEEQQRAAAWSRRLPSRAAKQQAVALKSGRESTPCPWFENWKEAYKIQAHMAVTVKVNLAQERVEKI